MTMTRKEAMQKIADAAEGQNLIGFGETLKEMFGPRNHSFHLQPYPMHVVTVSDSEDSITVMNKLYVEGAEHVVGEMAIG